MKSRVSKKSKQRKEKRIKSLKEKELRFRKAVSELQAQFYKKQQEEYVEQLIEKIINEGFNTDNNTKIFFFIAVIY